MSTVDSELINQLRFGYGMVNLPLELADQADSALFEPDSQNSCLVKLPCSDQNCPIVPRQFEIMS